MTIFFDVLIYQLSFSIVFFLLANGFAFLVFSFNEMKFNKFYLIWLSICCFVCYNYCFYFLFTALFFFGFNSNLLFNF